MPLDSHSYLVSQGWAGKGAGLRQGAISRPLAIPQKKTLAGLGKDRDEAFPFWDHLFSAAAKSIQIKCLSDEEEENESSTNSSNNRTLIKCTSTGILSNRRPIDGTPAALGTNTPENAAPGSQSYGLGLLATAKRDAAKRGLYSKFFRGPVLGPNTIIEEEEKRLTALVSQAFPENDSNAEAVSVQETIKILKAHKHVPIDLKVSKKMRKSRETKKRGTEDEDEDEEAKRERKRRRKEKKAESHATEKIHKKEKHKGSTEAENTEANSRTLSKPSPPPITQKDQKVEDLGIIKNSATVDHKNQADCEWLKKEAKKRKKRRKPADAE